VAGFLFSSVEIGKYHNVIAGTDFADMLLELITAGRDANERALRQDQVHEDVIRRSAMHRVARDIKKAMRFAIAAATRSGIATPC
jgi:hypothetical protein